MSFFQSSPTLHESTFVRAVLRSGVLTVTPVGPNVGQREAAIIADEINKQIRSVGKAMKWLVVDLSQVSFMSSMGLGTIIGFRNEAHALGATSVLTGANADLMGVLKMMKIDRLYQLAPTPADLKKVLGQ